MASCSSRHVSQQGFTLIEILVSLLIVSFGVLALVGLQGTAVRYTSDAQHRASATFLADQLMARILISDPATLSTFSHRPSGVGCSPTGGDSVNAVVVDWLDEVSEALPGAASTSQQIVVDTATREVTVRLCWVNGQSELVSNQTRQLTVTNVVQWQ